MSLDLWFAFVVATAVITLIPGPCVLLLIGQSLSQGMSPAFCSIVGILLGDLLLMVLSLMGLGTIMAASDVLFHAVKWAGVVYMAYLGYCQIAEARKALRNPTSESLPMNMRQSLKAGFLSAALNPKGIMFYMAFLTQFIDPALEPGAQIIGLIVTSTVVVAAILGVYVVAAAQVRQLLMSGSFRKYTSYVSGGCLMGGSVMMAILR
ncbi:LysE family translocator [Aestuariispira ectoiniformans]|uniref:LysE family translocator n=1 Tax=Aestuariispira ectoiniformans TaxID=2775080 RepID=UPI00223B319B|nr:LysE family translocator [Aestuariispira ectoiniformans]